MPERSFREALAESPLVFDGGMGSMLYGRGVFINRCFEELNLSEPARVQSVHADYVRAGAEVIETNTFGANAVKLEAHGFAERTEAINTAGARVARAAAQGRAFVAGSIGPLGIKIEPWGPTSVDEARAFFRQQAAALLEGQVDLIVLETFSDVNEIQQAIRAVRELAGEIPIVAQMTLGEDGNSLYGTAPEVFAPRLEQWGADVVGVNCSVGPAVMLDAVERMARVAHRPLAVQPNAGLPRNVDGRNLYLASPEYMARYSRRFLAAGARVVGGCCGTTPEHVRAMAKAVREAQRPRPAPPPATAVHEPAPVAPVARAAKSRLAARLADGRFAVAAEVAAARGLDVAAALASVHLLRQAGVDLIALAEAPRASAHMSPQALALLLEREAGVETLVPYHCRDRNLLGMQSDAIGAYALGLRNLIGETGNPPGGEEANRSGVFEVDSIGLVNMVRRLNEGFDVGHGPIGSPTGWHVGVRVNPTAIDLENEIRRFEWKADAGAEFCVTRPVFDLAALRELLKRVAHCRLPVLATVVALGSYQDAEYLANEVPGMRLPGEVVERMRRAHEVSPAAEAAEGVRLAGEILAGVRPLVEGVVLGSTGGRPPALELVQSALAAA